MADVLVEVRIRMYNVGFGDCFLLTFAYADDRARHVLIDFGTMGLPKLDGRVLHGTAEIAHQIETDCQGGQLVAVVATHRHQDHISGFAGQSGATIEALEPELVVQPWTEHPDIAEDATSPASHRSVAKRFSLLNDDVEQILQDHGVLSVAGNEAGRGLEDVDFDLDRLDSAIKGYTSRTRGVAENGAKELVFLGNNNIKNRSAVERLMGMGRIQPGDYLATGQRTRLNDLLPGVRIHVLGPPTAEEAEIGTQVAVHPTEFWHMAQSAWGPGLGGVGLADAEQQRFGSVVDTPVESRWLAARLGEVRPRDLLGIVRDLDDALNNTSLILLFDLWDGVQRRLLLFPGDAQIESWRHCFVSSEDAGDLPDVDVYKVGHHGSRNATPKRSLWKEFRKRGEPPSLVTLLSTMAGRHGHEENQTEVPRGPLVDALRRESRLVDTSALGDTGCPMYVDTIVRPGETVAQVGVADGDGAPHRPRSTPR